MSSFNLPDQETLHDILDYEPETGCFYWKSRTQKHFPYVKKNNLAIWNKMYAGEKAFTNKHNGYFRGKIFGTNVLAHRVAWCYHHGQWPTGEIDHINGVRDDNRISNLRDVAGGKNAKNRRISPDHMSGKMGVRWDKFSRRWISSITNDGKKIYLGSFKLFDDAVRVREEAEKKYFFHENHGRSS